MNSYKEFQFFRVLAAANAFVILTSIVLYALQIGTRPLGYTSFLLINAIMLIVTGLSHGMYTVVDDYKVKVHFGIGLVRRSIDLKRIRGCTIVKTPWYYGWGVRIIPGGWMFNVSGEYSVEIQLTDTNRIFRIGTQNPQVLLEAIQAAMRKNP